VFEESKVIMGFVKSKQFSQKDIEIYFLIQCWLPQSQEPDEKTQAIHQSYEQNSQLVHW
jgi:hypothetical protein